MTLAIDVFVEQAQDDLDQVLNGYVQNCNTALAKSDLTLHRKFCLIERGLVRILRHADRTRRHLKREADRVLRWKRER
jgi:hypothetical protein